MGIAHMDMLRHGIVARESSEVVALRIDICYQSYGSDDDGIVVSGKMTRFALPSQLVFCIAHIL